MPKSEAFITGAWGDGDKLKQGLARAIVNAERRRLGMPDLVSDEEGDLHE